MKVADRQGKPEKASPLTERLRATKTSWRRTFGDYFLTGLSYFVSAVIFVLALFLGLQSAEPSERERLACDGPLAAQGSCPKFTTTGARPF